MDIDLVKLMYQAPPEVRRSNEISLRLIEDGNPKLREIMTDRGVGGKSNRLFSMGARAYYEFLFKMDYFYNHGMPQWLARINYQFALLNLEKIFLGRHKYFHSRVWFRDEWSDYVREILLDERTMKRHYFTKGVIEEMVTSHIKGIRNYTTEIDMMLATELMHRLLIEQN
jgi:asparagine synthase (glutamine-hydrolysing)